MINRSATRIGNTDDELLSLALKLNILGYRRQWVIGDQVWYGRKRKPGLYLVDYVFHSRASSYIFITRLGNTQRVNYHDERLLHLPFVDDVKDWFQAQSWIDFYTLRTEPDATYQFTFYYHRRDAFQSFHHADERIVALQAMVAALELMQEIIKD